MSQPLTAERFEQFVELYTQHHSETVAHFETIETRLDKIDDRLDRIEKHLWNEQRFAEHERRIIKLAERTGSPDLATPFSPPIGS